MKNKYTTYIIIVVIVAITYLLGMILNISYKEYIRQDELKKENIQKILLTKCLDAAKNNYDVLWNSNCKGKGLKDNCSLDLKVAESIGKDYEKDRKECMDKFKNKAFEELKMNAF